MLVRAVFTDYRRSLSPVSSESQNFFERQQELLGHLKCCPALSSYQQLYNIDILCQ